MLDPEISQVFRTVIMHMMLFGLGGGVWWYVLRRVSERIESENSVYSY
jgi:hypothetical protein